MLNNILKSFHDMVDIILVGNMNREVAIRTAQKGAIGFVGPVLSICMSLAAGLMIAGVAIISQYIGAKREDKAKKVSGQLLLLCIIVGVVFNVILYFSTPAILDMMKVLPDVREPAIKYLQIRSFELVGLFIFYAYQASCQASGDTINPVIWNVTSIVINMVLTALFVLGFDMDLTGAAIATVIANNFLKRCFIRQKSPSLLFCGTLILQMRNIVNMFRKSESVQNAVASMALHINLER